VVGGNDPGENLRGVVYIDVSFNLFPSGKDVMNPPNWAEVHNPDRTIISSVPSPYPSLVQDSTLPLWNIINPPHPPRCYSCTSEVPS